MMKKKILLYGGSYDRDFIYGNSYLFTFGNSVLMCNGYEFNSTNVCLGRGSCIAVSQSSSEGVCDCDNGFYGVECELSYCGGKGEDDSNVCSGRGNCSEGVCECETDYSGQICQISRCFNYTSDLTDQVCSGKGECLEIDHCDCDSGRFGSECQYEFIEYIAKIIKENIGAVVASSVSIGVTILIILLIIVLICIGICVCKKKKKKKEEVVENSDKEMTEVIEVGNPNKAASVLDEQTKSKLLEKLQSIENEMKEIKK